MLRRSRLVTRMSRVLGPPEVEPCEEDTTYGSDLDDDVSEESDDSNAIDQLTTLSQPDPETNQQRYSGIVRDNVRYVTRFATCQ